MDSETVVRWLILFLGVLLAILIADELSGIIVLIAGLKGSAAFITNTILYAVILFAVIYLLKKYCRIDIFRFDRH